MYYYISFNVISILEAVDRNEKGGPNKIMHIIFCGLLPASEPLDGYLYRTHYFDLGAVAEHDRNR
jgi:hypothetical protein